MKEIIHEVLSKINWANTFKSLADHLPEKIVASAGVTSVASALGVNLQLYIAFVFLMVLDTLTRYLAQTAAWWKCTYPQTPYTLYDLWRFRSESRKWRWFKSAEMRKKFVSKFCTYLIVLAASSVCDITMQTARGLGFALTVATTFLALTELCSILENLQECGVKEVQGIMSIINKRKESIK